MDIIEALDNWLKNQPYLSKCKCDHATNNKENLGLYLGTKIQKKGRTQQIACPDLIVHDNKNVQIVIEVDPVNIPKKIFGDIFSVLIADNYTPSYTYKNSFTLDNIVMLYVTWIKTNQSPQKKDQLEEINKAIAKFIKTNNLKVRLAKVCYSNSPEGAIEETKKIISELFTPLK